MAPAGYSGTPLPKKLGIKEGHTVAVVDGPDHLPELLVPLPEHVVLRTGARARPGWPKKSSPLFRDLTEDGVRDLVLGRGLVDVKVCAIDDDYSGLKLMVRKEHR